MIQTRQLAYRYGAGPELRFPDLDLPQGGVVLLKGPSGSGKSTWLALAAGLLRPAAGSMVVAGQDLGTLQQLATDAWRARAIGFLPQKLHLSEALTVAGNLALAQWAAGVADNPAAVSQALQTLGLGELAARRPSQLSGGQAVLLRPRVILADEPTASLDDVSAQAALDLLAGTASRLGASLVIATHDARVAAALPQAVVCEMAAATPTVSEPT